MSRSILKCFISLSDFYVYQRNDKVFIGSLANRTDDSGFYESDIHFNELGKIPDDANFIIDGKTPPILAPGKTFVFKTNDENNYAKIIVLVNLNNNSIQPRNRSISVIIREFKDPDVILSESTQGNAK